MARGTKEVSRFESLTSAAQGRHDTFPKVSEACKSSLFRLFTHVAARLPYRIKQSHVVWPLLAETGSSIERFSGPYFLLKHGLLAVCNDIEPATLRRTGTVVAGAPIPPCQFGSPETEVVQLR